jgi:glycosyltransferase involved in cell wall biosynthesis
VLNYCKELQDNGVTSEILTSLALSARALEHIEGIKVQRCEYFYPFFGLQDVHKEAMDLKGGNLFSWELFGKLSEVKPDILHLHTLKRMGGIGRTVSRLHKIPYVVSLHGGVYNVPPQESDSLTPVSVRCLEWGKMLGALVGSRRVIADAARVICLNRSEQSEIEHRFPKVRTTILPNGVDLDRYASGNGRRFRQQYGIPSSREILLSVARIDPQKNQLATIRLLNRLAGMKKDVHLVLIGPVTSKSYEESLLSEANRLGLRGRLTLIPGLIPTDPTISDAYDAAEVFILPSRHEPFGIVVLEAWSAGLPVVVSDVGGLVDLVEHEKNGLRFPADDDDAFLQATLGVLRCNSKASAFGESGKEKVRRCFSWRAVTSQLFELYEEVLDEHTFCQSKRWFFRRC